MFVRVLRLVQYVDGNRQISKLILEARRVVIFCCVQTGAIVNSECFIGLSILRKVIKFSQMKYFDVPGNVLDFKRV